MSHTLTAPAVRRPLRSSPAEAPLRLTARGRVLILIATLAMALAVIGLGQLGGSADAADQGQPSSGPVAHSVGGSARRDALVDRAVDQPRRRSSRHRGAHRRPQRPARLQRPGGHPYLRSCQLALPAGARGQFEIAQQLSGRLGVNPVGRMCSASRTPRARRIARS